MKEGSQPTASDHVRETYAHFGLAVYFAQVLEHGIVNAMIVLRLPQKHRYTQRDIDSLMNTQFSHTLGKLLRNLRGDAAVPETLANALTQALNTRNALCHNYFRERAVEFMTFEGREQIILELKNAQRVLREADQMLEAFVQPIAERHGFTDAKMREDYDAYCRARGILSSRGLQGVEA